MTLRYTVNRSGCWIWTGAKNSHGYGHLRASGRYWQAHQLAYVLFIGAIPPRMEIDHLCRRRDCINPAHLQPVVTRTNLIRGNGWSGRNARKTHCKHGHPFNDYNTRVRKRGKALHRFCRECARLSQQRFRTRRKQANARSYSKND